MGAPHHDIDPAEFETWVTPSDALALFPNKPPDALQRAIGERLCMGLLHAAARTVIFGRGNPTQGEYHRITPAELQDWAHEIDHDFWTMGDTKVRTYDVTGYGQGLSRGTWFYDVRIERAGLEAMGAAQRTRPEAFASVQAQPEAVARPHPGGAPPKAYWEPLLIEMLAQYADGKLTPTRQADVERSMLDWLASQGHEASERSVRSRAKLVWNAIKTEGQ